MSLNIVAVCDNEESAKSLINGGKEIGYNIYCEIQDGNNIKNELSIESIKNSNVVLFVTNRNVEEIDGIERFIDREYYEVEPQFVINNPINNPINVLKEIASDLN